MLLYGWRTLHAQLQAGSHQSGTARTHLLLRRPRGIRVLCACLLAGLLVVMCSKASLGGEGECMTCLPYWRGRSFVIKWGGGTRSRRAALPYCLCAAAALFVQPKQPCTAGPCTASQQAAYCSGSRTTAARRCAQAS